MPAGGSSSSGWSPHEPALYSRGSTVMLRSGVILIKLPSPKLPSLQDATLPSPPLSWQSRLGLYGNRAEQKPHCPSPHTKKHHFWVSEVADPRPTPFLLPWATARREAGRPISSPPFLCQGFYSQGKLKIYICATENAAHPRCQVPLGSQAPLALGTPSPGPVARELRVLYSSSSTKKSR